MFHRFEVHTGDSNDNWIDEFIVEAESKDKAFEIIEEKISIRARCKERGIEVPDSLTEDGDDGVWYQMWYEDPPETDEEDTNWQHEDYYWQGEYLTYDEAMEEMAGYHGKWNDLLIDA